MHFQGRKYLLILTGALVLVTGAVITSGAGGSPGSDEPAGAAALPKPAPNIKKEAPNSRGKRVLLEGTATADPKKFSGLEGKCPKKAPYPVGGYFDSASEMVVLSQSRPAGNGKWAVGVTNLGDASVQWRGGIVCVK